MLTDCLNHHRDRKYLIDTALKKIYRPVITITFHKYQGVFQALTVYINQQILSSSLYKRCSKYF